MTCSGICFARAHRNAVKFAFVLSDSWFTNSENINCVLSMKKNLIGAVKSNLEVALSKSDRANGKYYYVPFEKNNLEKSLDSS